MFGDKRNRPSRAVGKREVLGFEVLEARECLSAVSINQVVTGSSTQNIPLTGVFAGQRVIIQAHLLTTDPNEFHEASEAEYLHIVTSGGEFVDQTYSLSASSPGQYFSFVAAKDNESIGAFIHNSDGDESGILNISTQGLTITIPQNQTQFQISAEPKMPEISAKAEISGGSIDLSNVTFKWQARVSFPAADNPGIHAKDIPEEVFPKTTVGPNVTFKDKDWQNKIRGGELTLTVEAVVNGDDLQGELSKLTIVGTNPDPAAVRTYLSGAEFLKQPKIYPAGASHTYLSVLEDIASQESTFQQFMPDGRPKFSSDNKGGAGLMQVTPASPDAVWDWKQNARDGRDKFNYYLNLAYRNVISLTSYLNQTERARINRTRASTDQIVRIDVPSLSADMIVEDAIRGYNGWSGTDPLAARDGLHLHEFTLSHDAQGNLVLVVDPTTHVGTVSWVRVPTTARYTSDGKPIGDPDYVNHVLSHGY